MRMLKQSIWYLLSHSWVTFFSIVMVVLVLSFMQFILDYNGLSQSKGLQASVSINASIGFFIGVYLGGGVLALKQFYLWKINQRYRSNILLAFVVITLAFCILPVAFSVQHIGKNHLLMFAPLCSAIFASQMVLGKNLLHKVTIGILVIAMLQLHKLGLDVNSIMTVFLLATLGLSYAMFKDQFYPSAKQKIDNKMDTQLSGSTITTGVKPAMVIAFNHYIGIAVSKWVKGKKNDIGWSLLLPQTKLGISSIIYIVAIGIFSAIADKSEASFFETITVMFLATVILAITVESRQMIRQARSFAHVFPGEKHRALKTKMLLALDKAYLINITFILLGALGLSPLLSLPLDNTVLLYSVLSIVLTALVALPGFLCLMWINVSLSNVLSYCGYLALVYIIFRWIGVHSDQLWSNPTTYLFIIGCIGLRFLTQSLFYRQPMERLIKNK